MNKEVIKLDRVRKNKRTDVQELDLINLFEMSIISYDYILDHGEEPKQPQYIDLNFNRKLTQLLNKKVSMKIWHKGSNVRISGLLKSIDYKNKMILISQMSGRNHIPFHHIYEITHT